MRLLNFIEDHPHWVSLGLALLVIAHGVASLFWPVVSPWFGLLQQPSEEIVALCLTVAGVTAIVSGFAGVVTIFGLSATSHAFRVYRQEAGESLVSNWLTPVIESLLAAVLAVIAALLVYGNVASLSVWALELSFLLALHGAGRLIWLFSRLTQLVAADDGQFLHDEAQQAVARMLKR